MKILPLFTLLAAVAGNAHATLVAYEPFDYAIADNGLSGATGGSGWATAWSVTNAAGTSPNPGDILAPTLSYTDGSGSTLVTNGNMAQMDGDTVGTAVNFRQIDTSTYGTSQVLYVSFLGQKVLSGLGTTLDSRAVNFALFSTGTSLTQGGAENISVGHGTNTPTGGFGGNYHWGHFYGGNGGNGQTPGATQTGHYSATPIQNMSFLVLKIELNANGANDRFSLYVNPTLSSEGLNLTSAIPIDNVDRGADLATMINRVRPFGGNLSAGNGAGVLNLDELRIGTTWADVTPYVPEPGSAALAGLAGLALMRRRRRA